MGRWLAVNGEAIYGTRPFEIYGEGPTEVLAGGFTDAKSKPFTGQDIRYTTKGNTLYAIALDWPGSVLTAKVPGRQRTAEGTQDSQRPHAGERR